jgi:hypothetical protein
MPSVEFTEQGNPCTYAALTDSKVPSRIPAIKSRTTGKENKTSNLISKHHDCNVIIISSFVSLKPL